MWYFALATLILFESTICLPQYDLANKDVYEIQEDKDSNTIKFINPKPAEPVLREITYYHLIERAYDGTVQTDKIIGSIDDPDLSTERPTTNAHGHEFEIDVKHDQIDHQSDQITEQPIRENDWFLQPSVITDRPLPILEPANQQFAQIHPSAVEPEDWFQKFSSSLIINEKPILNSDHVWTSVAQQPDWLNPAVNEEQSRPPLVLHPIPIATSTEREVIETESQDESIKAVEESAEEESDATELPKSNIMTMINPEEMSATANPDHAGSIVQKEVAAPGISDDVEESSVAESNPEEMVAESHPEEESVAQVEVPAVEASDLPSGDIVESISAIVENPEVAAEPVEVEGEVEVIEDPILTAAVIDTEGENTEEQNAGEEEIVEEEFVDEGDIQQTIADKYYHLVQSPKVLQDRYEKLRKYLPNTNLREPDFMEEPVEMIHSRKRRSARQPEEVSADIPEAPVLPPLNYDILPDSIRAIISTQKPEDEEEPLMEESHSEEHVEHDKIEEESENSDGVVNLDNKRVRTYGMSLNGDQGFVWNDMFSNPGMAYTVGENGEILEGHKEEPIIPQPPAVEDIPDHIGDSEANPEGDQSAAGEDMEDIFVDVDKEKNKQPSHFLEKPEEGISEQKEDVPVEINAGLGQILSNKQFWSWVGDWTSAYIDLFTEKFANVMREEISRIPPTKPIIADEGAAIEINADNDRAPKEENSEVKTLFINGKEISLTRTSNLEEELVGDEINEDMLRRRHNNDDGKEKVKVVSKAIYGNTIGNEKVTNIFVFFPESENNKLIESLKPLLGTKDEVKPNGDKEIDGNVNSSTEASATINPEEGSEDKIEQSKEPEQSSIAPAPEESNNANAEIVEPIEVEIEPTTVPIVNEEPVTSEVPPENSNIEVTTELSTQSNLEESSVPIATTEAPLIGGDPEIVTPIISVTEEPETSVPIDDVSTPIFSITEEPKTSEPIVEATTPAETNAESTIAPEEKPTVEESVPDGEEIAENSEVATENSEAKAEESSIAVVEESTKAEEAEIEASTELPSNGKASEVKATEENPVTSVPEENAVPSPADNKESEIAASEPSPQPSNAEEKVETNSELAPSENIDVSETKAEMKK